MKLIFFSMVVMLINAIPLSEVHKNHSFVAKDVIKSALAANVDPKVKLLLDKMMADADPAKLNQVITIIEEMISDAHTTLGALQGASVDANIAYDDAVFAYNQAVVDRDQVVADQDIAVNAAIEQRTQLTAQHDQLVTDALAAQNVALGAKDSSSQELTDQESHLNTEIASLEQVLSILQTLNGGTVSGAYLAMTDDAGVDVWLVPIPPFSDPAQEVCGSDVYAACQSVGLNSACYDLNHYDANGNVVNQDATDPNCRMLTEAGYTSRSWFQYRLGEAGCPAGEGSKYTCDAWTGKLPNLPAPGPTFVDVFPSYGTCGICSIDTSGGWCGEKSLLDGVGYAVCA